MARYLLYSHDTYGLGHFRRSALVATALAGADRDDEVLIATGSPVATAFELPDRVDALQLPAATKDRSGAYRPRKLRGPLGDLVRLRAAVLCATVDAYAPDVILVDHAPLGMAGELVPLLGALEAGARRPRLVLGLRDIVNDASAVDAEWRRCGAWPWLDRYDEILVYGDERILTTAVELDIAGRTGRPVTHTGFVAPAMPAPAADDPFVLVTAGGGGDGHVLVRRFLDAVEAGATDGLRAVVVTGPLMSPRRRDDVIARAARLDAVDVVAFTGDLRALIASATGVISMAGYNTVVEELAADVPALLVPRCVPRLEQVIRARRLAPHARLRHCPAGALTPALVHRFVTACRERRADRGRCPLDLGGARAVAAAVRGERRPPVAAAAPEREPARV